MSDPRIMQIGNIAESSFFVSPAVSRGDTKGSLLRRLSVCPSVCLSCLSRFSSHTSLFCNNSSSTYTSLLKLNFIYGQTLVRGSVMYKSHNYGSISFFEFPVANFLKKPGQVTRVPRNILFQCVVIVKILIIMVGSCFKRFAKKHYSNLANVFLCTRKSWTDLAIIKVTDLQT